MILRFVIVLAILSAAEVGLLVWAVSAQGPISVPAIIIFSISMVPLIAMAAFNLLWRPMLAPYPWQRPAIDAERRTFQSFSVGIVNMGGSIHASTDEECLHLEPLGIWQFLGATPASIPWTALSRVGKSRHSARFDGHTIRGPSWCFDRLH